jgi:hypothetical protein
MDMTALLLSRIQFAFSLMLFSTLISYSVFSGKVKTATGRR